MTAAGTMIDADERLRRRLAAFVALLLNLAFLVALDHVMRPLPGKHAPWSHAAPGDVLQVRLIEVAPAPAPQPQPAPEVPAAPRMQQSPATAPAIAPAERRASASARSKAADRAAPAEQGRAPESAREAMSEAADPAAPATPQFYDKGGQVRLPEVNTAGGEAPFPDLPIIPTEGNPFVHKNSVPYEPTRFDKYFPDVRETLGGELVRKAIVQRTARTPWGTQITCTIVLFFGGCTWGHVPRATIEELKAMRADPPMPKKPAENAGSSD